MEFTDHWMQSMFEYSHLPAHLKLVSQVFYDAAEQLVANLPTEMNVELTDQLLYKLWEAKNLAVVMAARYGD